MIFVIMILPGGTPLPCFLAILGMIHSFPNVYAVPTDTYWPTPGTIIGRAEDSVSGDVTDVVQPPRVGDVISHLQNNGGVAWTDHDDGSSSVFHTYEQWAAAEHAVMNYTANTFAHVMAQSVATKRSVKIHYSRDDHVNTSPNPLYRRDGLDGGHDIKEGEDAGDGKGSRAARFFCYNTGQYAKGATLSAIAGAICGIIADLLVEGGVRTWKSQRLPVPGPETNKYFVWFLQHAGKVIDAQAGSFCTFNLSQLNTALCQSNVNTKRDTIQITRGAVWRTYDSPPGTSASKLGAQLTELKADPNTCNDKTKDPC